MTTQWKKPSGFAIVTLVWSVLSLIVTVRPAAACSCAPSRSPCAQLQSGQTIFVGTPVSMSRGTNTVRFQFVVEERLSGEATGQVEIETASDTAACGYPFQIGEKYLVYAHGTSGRLSASICSRTAPLRAARDDLDLLRETTAGRPRARLSGSVVSVTLLLDGFYAHTDVSPGVPGVPITIRGEAASYEATTDDRGRFTVLGLAPGNYLVEPRLPAPYGLRFGPPEPVRVDACLGEALIFVTPMVLEGQVRLASGEPAGKQIMLRVAQLDADNRVAFDRSTLAFTDADGRWNLPGLPPGRYVIGVNIWDAPTPFTPFPALWFPNARDVANATVVDVRHDRPKTIEVQLPPALRAVQITGRVLNQNGEGIAGARIEMFDDDDPHAVVSWKGSMAHATADRSGRFSITGFAGRRYHVQATEPLSDAPRTMQSALVPVVDAAAPTLTVVIKRP